jgi:hypothetical protein
MFLLKRRIYEEEEKEIQRKNDRNERMKRERKEREDGREKRCFVPSNSQPKRYK